jgi:hypothetical protein
MFLGNYGNEVPFRWQDYFLLTTISGIDGQLVTQGRLRISIDTPDTATNRNQHTPVVFPMEVWHPPVGNQKEDDARQDGMKQKRDVQQGTLALMVLKTLEVLGPLHGYGIARRIEQISGELLSVNQGTLYPLLLRIEQEGAIASDWGPPRTTAGRVFIG